jgi:hypothetical protein
MEMEFAKWKWKRIFLVEVETKFFGESENGNRIIFSGGTDAEMEFSFPTDAKFPFYSGFA